MFYDERLKRRRRGWGLTILSISLIAFLTWLVLENTAWCVSLPSQLSRKHEAQALTVSSEIWCHYEYASSYEGYGITWDAPEYPYVIPTVLYRTFVKAWWQPLWALTVFVCKPLIGGFLGADEAASAVRSATVTNVATKIFLQQEEERILGMGADEFVR
jgi:hypothetical protein